MAVQEPSEEIEPKTLKIPKIVRKIVKIPTPVPTLSIQRPNVRTVVAAGCGLRTADCGDQMDEKLLTPAKHIISWSIR